MRPVKTFKCRGRRWKYRRARLKNAGKAFADTKSIVIADDLHGEDLLDTTIHEFLHAAYWDLDEEAIEETATDLARLLWRLGYRDPTSIAADAQCVENVP